MQKKYLEIGKIVGIHGIKGNIKVFPWCDSPEFLCIFKKLYFFKGKEKIDILSVNVNKNIVIMNIDKIDSIEKALKLKGQILYIDREDVKLEEGSYFIQDIIGLKVVNKYNGKIYGKISQVLKTGANDVYEIRDKNNNINLIPVIDEVVDDIDIDNSVVYITRIEGLFE